MSKFYLHEKIGDPVLMVAPAAHATDLVSTDHTGVPLKGAQGVLFILTTEADLSGTSATVSLIYASDGVSSNASSSSDIWGSTNMSFAALSSDSESSLFLLDLDIRNKAKLTNANGKIYAATGTSVGDGIWQLIGIPYGLTHTPTTNAQTVLER